MVEEWTAVPAGDRPADEPSVLSNAIVGGVVTVVTTPLLPLAAVIGGAIAGYLQRGDRAAAAKVGALSGAIAAVPAVLVAWFVVGVFLLGGDPVFALGGALAVFVFLVILGYLVVAGSLGGVLGGYLREEL